MIPVSFLCTWYGRKTFSPYLSVFIYVMLFVYSETDCTFRLFLVLKFHKLSTFIFNIFCFNAKRVAAFKCCYIFSVIQAGGVFLKALTDISCTW